MSFKVKTRRFFNRVTGLFSPWFSLTSDERKVVIILVTVLIAGMTVREYRRRGGEFDLMRGIDNNSVQALEK